MIGHFSMNHPQDKNTHHILAALHLRQVPHLVQVPLAAQVSRAQVRDAFDTLQPAQVVQAGHAREVRPRRQGGHPLERHRVLFLAHGWGGLPSSSSSRTGSGPVGPAEVPREPRRLEAPRGPVSGGLGLLLLLRPAGRALDPGRLTNEVLVPREKLHKDRMGVCLIHLAPKGVHGGQGTRGVHGRERSDGV